MKPFKKPFKIAKYEGMCKICGQPVKKGSKITYENGNFNHTQCCEAEILGPAPSDAPIGPCIVDENNKYVGPNPSPDTEVTSSPIQAQPSSDRNKVYYHEKPDHPHCMVDKTNVCRLYNEKCEQGWVKIEGGWDHTPKQEWCEFMRRGMTIPIAPFPETGYRPMPDGRWYRDIYNEAFMRTGNIMSDKKL